MLVPLRGKHADGRAFVLNAADHARLCAASVGPWSLVSNAKGRCYVVGRHWLNGTRITVLARWLLGARRGDVVTYLDGNPLNLRRTNLRLLRQGEELTRWRRAQTATLEPPMPRGVRAARACLERHGFTVLEPGT